MPSVLRTEAFARWARAARVQQRSQRNGRVFHADGWLRLGRNTTPLFVATLLFNAFGDRFDIFCGVDDLIVESMSLGVVGWVSGMTNVFFCSTGLEANEGALKIARKYGHDVLGLDAPQTMVFEGAFHGRSLATLSATANP